MALKTARTRHHIWSLGDSNGIRTHNHLVRKRTFNHLAKLTKWLSCVVSTYLYGTFDIWIFTLKLVRDVIIRYSQMHHTNKYSQYSPIIWPVWLNGWVFVYEVNGRGFEFRCCHLNKGFHCGNRLKPTWDDREVNNFDAYKIFYNTKVRKIVIICLYLKK